jgi:hypothetical protein
MIRKSFCIAILMLLINFSYSQELNCTVDIEFSKTQTADPKVFENLKSAITEFMNSRKWTNDVYEIHEKIAVSILINIDQEFSASEFGGQFIIQSERPVFNSNYKTVVFSNKDDNFRFEYNEFGNLDYSDNNYISNLTSFLAYYAYMVIGFDYETFSPDGGTPYFLKAQDVINAVPVGQRARYPGWDGFGNDRNRSTLVKDILNPRFKAYREALLKFHFTALDNMYDNAEKSRKEMTLSLELMQKIHKDNPASFLIIVFFLAKSDELISIYSKAPSSEKTKIIEMLSNMDPTNTVKYKAIGN